MMLIREKSNFLLELPRNMFLNIPIDFPCVRFIVKLSSRNGREWSQEECSRRILQQFPRFLRKFFGLGSFTQWVVRIIQNH